MQTLKIACLMLLLALLPRAAEAFTPEPGIWWNPAEDGRGYAIEIQNDVLILLVVGYDADRTSSFFNSAGRIGTNGAYRGSLDGYAAGQCLTCAYSGRPVVLSGAGGEVVIDFDSTIRGRMTIGGRTIPIERYNFATGDVYRKMLGQWQIVVDVSSRATGAEPRFTADVLNLVDLFFSYVERTNFAGCRPTDAATLVCRNDGAPTGRVQGYSDFATGRYVLTVFEGRDADGRYRKTQYQVTTGLNEFEGFARVLLDDVVQPGTFPVRGFRSAGRYQVRYGPLP